jgi:hypothetical protein
MKTLRFLVPIMIGIAAPALAQPAGWTVLGFKTVGAGSDHDVIRVNPGPAYAQLQLCAFDAPINMQDFHATFGNGTGQDFAVRSVIRVGTCTRNIPLRGGARHITRIDLRYAKLFPGSRAPLVRVMGR